MTKQKKTAGLLGGTEDRAIFTIVLGISIACLIVVCLDLIFWN